MKLLLCIGIIVFTSHSSHSQFQEQLKSIISSEASISDRQDALDRFFEFREHDITEAELADCYHDYAYQWYFKQGWKGSGDENSLNQSLFFFNKSLVIKRGLSDIKPTSIKRTLYNMGIVYSIQAEYFDAIRSFSEIIEIEEVDVRTINAYRELGIACMLIGDFHRAIDYFDKLILLSVDFNDQKRIIQGYYRRAEAYSLLDRKRYSEQIKSDIDSALSVIELGSKGTAEFRYELVQLEGNRLLAMEDYDASIRCFIEVLKGLEPFDSTNQAIVYNSLGFAQLKLQKFDQSYKNLQKSIAYSSKFSPAYENLGDLFMERNDLDKSLEMYEKAIGFAAGRKEDEVLDALVYEDLQLTANKYDLLHHLIQKANLLITSYRVNEEIKLLHESLRMFNLADQLVDLIRFESLEQRSKLYWREKSALLYLNAVELCYLLDKPERAYYFMEKNKAVLLLEDISNDRAQFDSDLPQAISAREFNLKRNIFLYENELSKLKERTEYSLEEAKDELMFHKHAYEKFIDSVQLAFPKYASIKMKVNIVPEEMLRRDFIDETENTLHYIMSENKGYGLLNTKNQSYLFLIDSVQNLQNEVDRMAHLSSKILTTKEELSDFNQVSNRVFKRLFPANIFQNIIGQKLTIIPDHVLQKVSFETLMHTFGENESFLINQIEIRYAYSISHMKSTQDFPRDAPSNFIAFAPVVFNSDTLNELTMSQNEAASLQKLCKGQVMMYEHATKKSFLESVNNYRIVHLSTHADIGGPMEPWIAFFDEKLTLPEIYATKNRAEMVVLSACNTSLGELKKGEGLMSFARSFFYSGSHSVVSSLWSTNDKASSEIMINFYEGLAQGLSKSAALRKAKLHYMNTHSGIELSPYYWGALILIGDNSEIKLFEGLATIHLVFFFFIAISIIVASIYWIRKKPFSV